MNYDIPQDRTTTLETIHFPLPIRGSLTTKRVQFDRTSDNPKFFYVRLYIAGKHRRIACTTDEAKACRFADMAACRFKGRGSADLNYSLEQVALDEQIPEARALLDELEELYQVEKPVTLEQRVEQLEVNVNALMNLIYTKRVEGSSLAPLDYIGLSTSQDAPPHTP